jgi:hypothetical protein
MRSKGNGSFDTEVYIFHIYTEVFNCGLVWNGCICIFMCMYMYMHFIISYLHFIPSAFPIFIYILIHIGLRREWHCWNSSSKERRPHRISHSRSSRRRRTGPGGAAWVPWPQTLCLPERQASENSKSPMFYKYQLDFFMFDALGCRSWLVTLDAYALLVLTYILKAYVGLGSNKCFAMLFLSYHLRDIGRYLVTVGYICYHRNNHVMII